MPFFDVETWYDSPVESITFVCLDGVRPGGVVKNIKSDTSYDVVSGEAIFSINGVKHLVEAGQMVNVPRNTLYQSLGNLAVMLATSRPRFDSRDVEVHKHNSLQTD